MPLHKRQDFWSGVMLLLLGSGFARRATSYQLDTAARMRPGYFPFWLGLLLAMIGAMVLLGALLPKGQPAPKSTASTGALSVWWWDR
jgi:hypothetical protein